MLTHARLVALHRALANKRVLSVYLDGTASDPALQRSWRLQLDHSLLYVRRQLEEATHAEREELEQCVRQLETAVTGFASGIGAPGWAAFITPDSVHDAQLLPVPTPTIAVWRTGPYVAPYMRALKEDRPVIVIVADARRATIYRYRSGRPERIEVVRSHHILEHPEHLGAPPRRGFHTGTRGTAGRDAAQRTLLQGRDRMIVEAADKAHGLAGGDGWILIGGIKRVAARLAQHLMPLAPNRVTQVGSLDVHATEADVAQTARSASSELRDLVDERRIADILDLAGAHGLGAAGPADARRALAQSSVRDLYFTHHYLEEHAPEAEDAVRSALDQDASVEEVSGRAADRLNQHGGIAAGLRFRSAPAERAIASSQE